MTKEEFMNQLNELINNSLDIWGGGVSNDGTDIHRELDNLYSSVAYEIYKGEK